MAHALVFDGNRMRELRLNEGNPIKAYKWVYIHIIIM